MTLDKKPSSWWIPGFDQAARQDGMERIASGAEPGVTYFILIILSTLIAGYGLLSNSTATVIGAMIVAPLMGPILGLAMGIVSGDAKLFRRSLLAEVSGATLVIVVGFLTALLVGVEQVDFSATEIANRTRPTLYDLAIGLAAGLAGAFCMVHPGLQASVAGVAIAVALVPPLAVTGITAAGWWTGGLDWQPALGSFMLFLANYLTIELAASFLFYAVGFHVKREGRTLAVFRKTIAINLILLLVTVVFLSQQLRILVRERVGMVGARKALEQELSHIPGADLDSLNVVLRGNELSVQAVVGSRQSISPTTVAAMERQLREALVRTLPEVAPRLVVRTVNSVYASPTGYLFEPPDRQPTPEQEQKRRLEEAINQALQAYPEVENEGVRLVSGQGPQAWDVELTLRSPFEFTSALVAELEERVRQSLGSTDARLLVRTVVVKVATADDQVGVLVQEAGELENPLLHELLRQALEASGVELTLLTIRRRPAKTGAVSGLKEALTAQAYDATVEIRAKTFLAQARLDGIRESVRKAYRDLSGVEIELGMLVRTNLSETLMVGGDSVASDR